MDGTFGGGDIISASLAIMLGGEANLIPKTVYENNKTYLPEDEEDAQGNPLDPPADGYSEIITALPMMTKYITKNGTYIAANEPAAQQRTIQGYTVVYVNVPQQYTFDDDVAYDDIVDSDLFDGEDPVTDEDLGITLIVETTMPENEYTVIDTPVKIEFIGIYKCYTNYDTQYRPYLYHAGENADVDAVVNWGQSSALRKTPPTDGGHDTKYSEVYRITIAGMNLYYMPYPTNGYTASSAYYTSGYVDYYDPPHSGRDKSNLSIMYTTGSVNYYHTPLYFKDVLTSTGGTSYSVKTYYDDGTGYDPQKVLYYDTSSTETYTNARVKIVDSTTGAYELTYEKGGQTYTQTGTNADLIGFGETGHTITVTKKDS